MCLITKERLREIASFPWKEREHLKDIRNMLNKVFLPLSGAERLGSLLGKVVSPI